MNQSENILKLKNSNQYFICIVIFFIAYCFFLSWSFLYQNVDDAYISYRYGKNLMNGKGLVYNPGEYVEGYTNFLWTIVTAPFTKVPAIDVSVFSIALCMIISILNIFFITRISRLFNLLVEFKTGFIFLLPALFYVLDDSIAFWSIGGMEFPMYILFILGIIYNYFRLNDNKKQLYYLITFLILCTLTRPEGNMIFVITIFHMFIFRKRLNNPGRAFIKIILFYSVFCALYYGFKYFYYGQIIPNTFYAKGVTDMSMNLILGTKYIIMCVGIRLYVLIFILFIPFKKAFRGFKLSYLLLFSIIYIVYIVAVGGDWMYANRFFVPIIPILYILSAIGFISLFIRIKEYLTSVKKLDEIKFRKWFIGGITILNIALFAITFSNLEYKRLIIEEDNANFERQWSRFGQWLKLNSPSNTIIAVGPAGKIPYYSELYSIDMWGLNNTEIARTKSKRLQAGHKKFNFDYVLSLNPEYIIGYAGFNDLEMPTRYQKFNAPEDYYKCYDVVFRLKEEYRKKNLEGSQINGK